MAFFTSVFLGGKKKKKKWADELSSRVKMKSATRQPETGIKRASRFELNILKHGEKREVQSWGEKQL